jgi:protein-S-isoprenylcysteine O-methyltransferase Ste14
MMGRATYADDAALTFCDQCGYLQPGVRSECEQCGVPLDRSVYDPFVAISQNAAVVRQAVRGRAKPSPFGKFAIVALGLLYLSYSAASFHALIQAPFSILELVFVLLNLAVGLLILAGFRRMLHLDTWDEYRRWSDGG